MPRRPRFNLPELPQHIVQRGNNRQVTFVADGDYSFYRECVKDAADKYGCDIHAYVLMTNHVHLLATPHKRDSISRMMQSIGRRYVQYVNFTYKRSGTLWEGRHKTSLVDTEQYLLLCYRYIEMNPVRARIVEHPADYPWSSYRANAEGKPEMLLREHGKFLELGRTEAERQTAYRELFRYELDPGLIDEIRISTNLGLVIGNDRFKEEIASMLKRSVTPSKRGRPFNQRDIHGKAEQLTLLVENK